MTICEYGLLDYGVPVYGACTVLYSIDPDVGPLTGGTLVDIGGAAFLFDALDDPFDDGALDPILWTASVVGAASSVGETDRLRLQAGVAAGNSGSVDSVAQVGDTDVSVEFAIATPIDTSPPAGDVDAAALQLRIDANNYAVIARVAGPRDRFEARVVVAGVTIEAAILATDAIAGEFRVIRDGTTVYLYVDNVEILRRAGFPSTPANVRVTVANGSTAYSVVSTFSGFRVRTMVMFAGEPMLDAVVLSDDRIRGTTPAGVRVATVAIHFATGLASLDDFVDAFTYEDAATFLIADAHQPGVVAWLSNDPILRNRRPGRPGFLR